MAAAALGVMLLLPMHGRSAENGKGIRLVGAGVRSVGLQRVGSPNKRTAVIFSDSMPAQVTSNKRTRLILGPKAFIEKIHATKAASLWPLYN